MSCEAVKRFLYRVNYLASRLVQEERMQKTNIRDRISQRKYVLARLVRQCLLCMQSTEVSCRLANLLATKSCLPQYSLAGIERQLASYRLTQYAQVKVRQLGSQIKLLCQLARQHTMPHSIASLGTQLASSQVPQVRYVASSLVTFSQLARYLTQLGCFQVVYLGQSLAKQRGGVSGILSQLLNSFEMYLALTRYLALVQAGLSQLSWLALHWLLFGWVHGRYLVQMLAIEQQQQYRVHLVQLFFFGLNLFLFKSTQPEVAKWNRAVTTANRKTSPNSIGSLICSYLCIE